MDKVKIEHITNNPAMYVHGQPFTVESNKSGDAYTFKITDQAEYPTWKVWVLSGPQNTSDYTSIGYITRDRHTGKPLNFKPWDAESAALSVVAFGFFWRHADYPNAHQMTIYHSGHCMVCGRLLTTPESVRAGIGPVCAGRI